MRNYVHERGMLMTEKKARVISIIVGIFFYILLSYLAVSNNPFSTIRNNYFLSPVLAAIFSLVVISFSRKRENIPAISMIQLWLNILLQLISGLYALISVLVNMESFTEIDWVMYVLAFSIGINGWELFLKSSRRN